ncbi:MAG: response regulator [Anaerolineae bacterium]|nr:response regulator [Anaerolineae bacterium]
MNAGKRILIVDDEEKVVFFLRESLEELGQDFTIGTARSAEEALAKIARQPYDLVISDLRMPGADGLHLLKTIKDKHPHTRFILMTAYGSDEVKAGAQRLEAYHYITKPFHVADLLRVARDALAQAPETKSEPRPLPAEQTEPIERALSNLRFEVGAQCVCLADLRGKLIAEVGLNPGLDTGTLLPLVAKGRASASGMAEYLQDQETFNLNFYEGHKYDIYSTTVGNDMFLTLIFDRTKQPSRIGTVWLYVKRTTQELLRTLGVVAEEEEEEDLNQNLQPSAPPEPPAEEPAPAPDRPTIEASQSPRPAEAQEPAITPAPIPDSSFGIEEALRKGLIDEEFALLLKGEG